MPIQVASSLVPRDGNSYPILDDRWVAGGYKVVADNTERDALDAAGLKPGSAVYVQSTGLTHRVDSIVQGVISWADFFPTSGGGGAAFDSRATTVMSHYFACTDAGLEVKIVSSATVLGAGLSWSRAGTVLTINHALHNRSVGERAIVRGANADKVVGEITSVAAGSFTLNCPDSGPNGGSDTASYSMGVTWKHFRADGTTPALGLENSVVRVGKSYIPTDAGIIVHSARLRFAANLRETTTYSYELSGTEGNGFGNNNGNWKDMQVPMLACRSENNTVTAAAATMNANVDGIPYRFSSAGMPGANVGCFLQLQF